MQDELRVIGINEKGYGIVPKLVMQDNTLDIRAKAVYAYFCSFSGSGSSCFPTRKKICYDLGISNDTLGKYLNMLCEHGYIEIEQVKESGRFSHNIYKLNNEILPYPKISDTVDLDTNINRVSTINSGYIYNPLTPTGERPKKRNAPKCSMEQCQTVIGTFKSICTDLPVPTKITDARRKAINRAWEDVQAFGGWEKFFETIQASDWLCGRKKDSDWKANFDWVLKPANMTKIIEGNYAKNQSSNPKDHIITDADYNPVIIFGDEA